MKILTAIELLRHNSTQRRMQEMEDLKSLIMLASDGLMTDKDFDMNWLEDGEMMVNLDEVSIDIDGLGLAEWLNANCRTAHESDKSIVVRGLL